MLFQMREPWNQTGIIRLAANHISQSIKHYLTAFINTFFPLLKKSSIRQAHLIYNPILTLPHSFPKRPGEQNSYITVQQHHYRILYPLLARKHYTGPLVCRSMFCLTREKFLLYPFETDCSFPGNIIDHWQKSHEHSQRYLKTLKAVASPIPYETPLLEYLIFLDFSFWMFPFFSDANFRQRWERPSF